MTELVWQGKIQHKVSKFSETDAGSENSSQPSKLLVTTETINPQPEQRSSSTSLPSQWQNRLILGDKQYVLPALLPEFAEKVNLIYIDPPYMTGRDFKSGEQVVLQR